MKNIIPLIILIAGLCCGEENILNSKIELALVNISEGKVELALRNFRIGYNATLQLRIQPDHKLIDKYLSLAASEADNKKSAAYYAIAMLLVYRTGNKIHPHQLFEIAKSKYPDLPELYNHKAVMLFEGENYAEIVQLLNKAIEINPKYADALRNRGTALQYLGKFDKAEADYLSYQELIQP